MNTANNKRRRESRRRIENAFVQLLQDRSLQQLRVSDICNLAEVNRTTFYANYVDIYDLADKVQLSLENEVLGLYQDEIDARESRHDFLKLFRHIKENPLFYKTYFKLNSDGKLRFAMYDMEEAMHRFDNEHIEYHIAFFANGLNAVIKKWLENDCKETPEEIFSIIRDEYKGLDWHIG